MDYHWPGNVRELENAIEHGFVLCNTDQAGVFDLPTEVRQSEYQPVCYDVSSETMKPFKPGKTLTRKNLLELLAACDWNKAEVARRIGLSRTAVWKYMKKWDIPLKKPS